MLKLGLEAITMQMLQMQMQYMRNDLTTSKRRNLIRSGEKGMDLATHQSYLARLSTPMQKVNQANKLLLRIFKQ